MTRAYQLYYFGQGTLSRLWIVCVNLVRPMADSLTFLCFSSVLVYQCKCQVNPLSSPALGSRKVKVATQETVQGVSEEVVSYEEYDTTVDLMALSQSERGLSITSANEIELSLGSSRLEMLLNPKFENFERFLKSLIEVDE